MLRENHLNVKRFMFRRVTVGPGRYSWDNVLYCMHPRISVDRSIGRSVGGTAVSFFGNMYSANGLARDRSKARGSQKLGIVLH